MRRTCAAPLGAGLYALHSNQEIASAGSLPCSCRRFLVAAVLALTAPAPPATAIIGGTAALTGTFPSLAYVVDFQGQLAYQCTGTVIAPSLVPDGGSLRREHANRRPVQPVGLSRGDRRHRSVATGRPRLDGSGCDRLPGLERKVDNGDVALLVLSTPTSAPTDRVGQSQASQATRRGRRGDNRGLG